MQLIRTLARALGPKPTTNGGNKQRVYRVIDASEVADAWVRRIVELSDGKSIGEIVEVLYGEEIRAGSWAVDIGLWRNLFDQSVVKAIGQLADSGQIWLKTYDNSEERMR